MLGNEDQHVETRLARETGPPVPGSPSSRLTQPPQPSLLLLRDISHLSLANYVTYHVCWREELVTGPPGPGHALSTRRITGIQ